MKIPSLDLLTASFKKIVVRFPFTVLSAFVGSICAIMMAHEVLTGGQAENVLIKLTMIAGLSLPLSFAVHLFLEKVRPSTQARFISFAIMLLLLVQLYFSFGNVTEEHAEIYYRYFIWSAGLHLCVAFSAFFIAEEINGFWQINKLMFLRFLTAGLYSGVLFLGLAGALAAIHVLFEVQIDERVYLDLWILIAGLFNTIFFLGGIPERVADLNEEHSYPKGLKIFTQYVLIPLVTIYLLILYAYSAKILFTMTLPKGWVANLILGFSVTGILSLLLVYPIRNEEENKWIKVFSRFFYFSLLPLIVLLFIAIGKRIGDYGVTIERYIVAMLGVWLTVITLYFILSRRKNIILIPLSLALFLFGSCFGPWGMFSLSEHSQLTRLKQLLEKTGAMKSNKIVHLSAADAAQVKVADMNRMNSILSYLSENHGFEGMQEWLDADCRSKVFTDSMSRQRYEQKSALQTCIGLYGDAYYRNESEAGEIRLDFASYENDPSRGIDVHGFNTLSSFYANDYDTSNSVDSSNENQGWLDNNELRIYKYGQLMHAFKLDSVAKTLRSYQKNSNYTISLTPKEMTFDINTREGQPSRLLLKRFDCLVTDTSLKITSVDGYLLTQ